MKWKLTLQFIMATLIIAGAASFISAAVSSYYYYVSSNANSPAKMIVSFGPNTLDVNKLVALVMGAEKKTALDQNAQDMLKKSESWIQVIDSNGNEIKSYNKPHYVQASYTTEDIEELKENPGMYKGFTTTIVNRIAKVQIDKGEIDKEIMTKEQILKAQISADQSPITTFVLGVSKPKITVFSILYSAFSYLTDWENPKSSPKIVSLLLTLPVVLLLGYLFARKLAKPVVKITDGIAAMSKGNFQMKYPTRGLYKEVYTSLYHMAKVLQSNEVERKRIEKMREDWITNISHDLKTPLSSIKGYIELLVDNDERITVEERKKYSQIIMDKSNYMEVLLDDLKLAQKLKNDLIPLNKSDGNLVELLRDVIIDILNNPKYEFREISFEPDEENMNFCCDPILIKRAFSNLIYNAIIHNPDNTTVQVRTSKKQGICVEIEDNGKGISEEDQNNLFERYYRGTNTSKSDSGSGLGLAISKQIIEAHGGQILLESTIGKGTKISILFD
ncbi:MAG: hypothetical protein APF84_09355 [Gracilibacter sp. BRH_c7a]|nr:MAG: hypothetical protein APF84_09355 [Gracilibacter sp. BRH_c7a]